MSFPELLARALLDGIWSRRALARRLLRILTDTPHPVRRSLLSELFETFATAPTLSELRLWLADWAALDQIPTVIYPQRRVRFDPAPPFVGLDIPRLTTIPALAQWLGISVPHLEWFADTRRTHGDAAVSALQHYSYRFVEKRSGAHRLIEAPKPAVKLIQRQILHEILNRVPPPEHAHGFVARRSAITGAQIHAGEAMVITVDLAQFFPSVPAPAVTRLFRRLGYPLPVARLLCGLCTTVTPAAVLAPSMGWWRLKLFGVPHLAQGAPTSPALANFAAVGLDCRLAGLARTAGAAYTRYADDLAFSGDAAFARRGASFLRTVEQIVHDEGFRINPDKTRRMHESTRQTVTGIVINQQCNVRRSDYDALKATLHDCALHGPAAANRAGHPDFRRHLEGRVVWVEQVNLRRGLKLRELLARIDWH